MNLRPALCRHSFALIPLGILFFSSLALASMRPCQLRCEYKAAPFIDVPHPRLSWLLEAEGRGQRQLAYQILVASNADLLMNDRGDLWDSGRVESSDTFHIVYAGRPLTSRQHCYWRVRVWDQHGNVGPWSRFARWEMGLLDPNEWQAEWIGLDLTHLGKGKVYHLPPAPYLRKSVQIGPEIEKARLYVTALGLYEFVINGEKVSEDWFSPGWTNYNKRVHYQVYDVTNILENGENALAVILSYGWYAGYVGYAQLVKLPQVKGFYGDVPALKARLEVEYADGHKDVFVTDTTWKANHGPLIETDLLHGETYDARLEFDLWDDFGYDDSEWAPAQVIPQPVRHLQCHPGNPIREFAVVKPKSITPRDDGSYIVDLGQNFAGVVRLRAKGRAGDRIQLRFGEMLHPDGRLMTENLRMARATDTYIMRGDPYGETWTPRFTFHGFQYVEITGYPGRPNLTSVMGLALSSDTPRAGSFACSNDKVNQLYSNIVWTQRANFIDIPTDCPQRDERMGWTGDAQIYVGTAALNTDIAAFYTKWLQDLNDDQWPDGSYPNFAPRPFNRKGMTFSPGWMEAGVICPYHIYRAYGDKRLVETCWPHMERFMAFHEKRSQGRYFYPEASFEDIVPKGGFSDWLSVGKKTSPDMLATMYYGYCAQLMAQMADGIGKTDRGTHYRDVADRVRQAFGEHYVRADGRFKCDAQAYGDGKGYVDGERGFTGHTQTAYANAIALNLLPADRKIAAGQYLAGLVAANDGKLTTGFLGVKPLLPALSQQGHTEVAYQLLLNEGYPSWLFEVVNGATSIWERWNSYTRENGFMAGMNSFSHYSFGAVYDWMFQYMAGIQNPGVAYKHIVFRPELDPRITEVEVTHRSIRGDILSHWRVEADRIDYAVTVPPNVTASVYLPAATAEGATEGERPLETVKDLKIEGLKDGYLQVEVGSGSYHFGATLK
jgi:alpha-L-rhamnosidase